MKPASTPTPSQAAREVTLIQIGRRALHLDDDTYRTMLANLAGGKTSSKDLNAAERTTVLNHMKARGFVVKPSGARGSAASEWAHEPMLRKLRAMWYVLADAGEVDRPADTAACNAAIERWAKRQFARATPQLDALRFATGGQMHELVEAMKQWLRRLGLATA